MSADAPAPRPRGERRIVFNSDPSTIATGMLPDPVAADDLRRWVDLLGDAGVDTMVQDCYNQGFTPYWRTDRFPYDTRPQHRRFLPLLDAGIQPLQVLADRCHERGMTFLGGLRMNDTHDFPKFAEFVESHPEFQLPKRWDVLGIERPPEAAIDRGGKPLDFTFEPVRAFLHAVVATLLDTIDVDGVELVMRDPGYFPVPDARDRAHLMTDLIRRIRQTLDDHGRSRGRRLLLGARVFPTLDECLGMGLDVPAWVAEGLIDYCAPMDTMFCDFSAEYAEFGALTRAPDSSCMLYPGLHPWVSHRRRRRKEVMSPSMSRALAHTFYGGGADGVSVFNHFVGHLFTPPYYPQALQVFHDLRDPQRVAAGERHYVFDPTWGGVPWMGMDRTSSGVVKAQRVTLDRTAERPAGTYRFRLYERMDQVRCATLALRGPDLTERDELAVALNGMPLADGPLGRADTRAREGPAGPPNPAVPARPVCPDTRWFVLPADAPAHGENNLAITLDAADPQRSSPVIIDEVEIWVQPC